MHRAQEPPRHGDSGREERAALFGHELAAIVDLARPQVRQVVGDDEVGQVAGRYRPAVAQPEVGGGVDGGELDGPQRVQAQADGLAHHGVQVAVVEEVPGRAVVHHQQAAGVGVVGHQGQELLQVLLGRALADHEAHAAAQLVAALLQAGRLVVGAGAGGQVGVEALARQAGGVAVDEPVADHAGLVQAVGVAGEDAGEVHQLAQAQGVGPAQGAGDVLRLQGGAGRLQAGGRHAGRRP